MCKSAGHAPSMRVLPPGICLATKEKARKTLSQGKKEPQSGTATKEQWNNKLFYTIASCWSFL